MLDDDTPLFDVAQVAMLRDALGADELSIMYRQLPGSIGRSLDAIDAALAAGDLAAIRSSSHALKGVASSFAAVRLEAIARQLELDVTSLAEAAACREALVAIARHTEDGVQAMV